MRIDSATSYREAMLDALLSQLHYPERPTWILGEFTPRQILRVIDFVKSFHIPEPFPYVQESVVGDDEGWLP